MIVRPPGDPVTSSTLAVARDDRRRHRTEHPLARRDEVGVRADVAGRVGQAGLLVEVAHLVVQQDAGPGDDDVRSVAALERVGVRDGHPVLVDHREVRGLIALRSRQRDDVLAEVHAARRPWSG